MRPHYVMETYTALADDGGSGGVDGGYAVSVDFGFAFWYVRDRVKTRGKKQAKGREVRERL